MNLLDEKRSSYFKVWNARTKNIFNATHNSSTILDKYSGDDSESDGKFTNCVSLAKNDSIDTATSSWYISAQLEGHPILLDGSRPETLPYCYAYAFTPIRISYGPCEMSVSSNFYYSSMLFSFAFQHAFTLIVETQIIEL